MKKIIFTFYRKSVLKAVINRYGYDIALGYRTIASGLDNNVHCVTILRLFKQLESEGLLTVERVNNRNVIYHINKKVWQIIDEKEKQIINNSKN